jgi:hypothetical protein
MIKIDWFLIPHHDYECNHKMEIIYQVFFEILRTIKVYFRRDLLCLNLYDEKELF